MAKAHGKDAVFSLDDLGGSLTDISSYLRSAGGLPGSAQRMDTTTFGEDAIRKEVMGKRTGGPISLGGPFNPAGVKVHGKDAVFLLDQYAPYSAFRSFSISRTLDRPQTDTFGDDWTEVDVAGLKDGSLSLDGTYDPATAKSDAVLRDFLAQGTPAVGSLGLAGFAIGSQVEMGQFACTNVGEPTDHTSLVSISSQFEADDVIDLGVSLHAVEAETATGGFTSVDETATTSQGGVAHLHVTAFSGTNALVTVQHSADNSTWADLISFATVDGVGVERALTAAVTTDVHRYVRGIVENVGTPSTLTFTTLTFGLAFARRGYAYGTAGRHRHFAGLYSKGATSSSFEYGPGGSASGARKLSGECFLTSYSLNVSHDGLVEFSAELAVSGAVTEGTY